MHVQNQQSKQNGSKSKMKPTQFLQMIQSKKLNSNHLLMTKFKLTNITVIPAT